MDEITAENPQSVGSWTGFLQDLAKSSLAARWDVERIKAQQFATQVPAQPGGGGLTQPAAAAGVPRWALVAGGALALAGVVYLLTR